MKGKGIKPFLMTFVLCYCFWLLLTLSIEVKELVMGLIVCGLSAWFTSGFFVQDVNNSLKFCNPIRLIKLVYYLVVILGSEIFKANCAVAKNVIFNQPIKQAIIKIKVNGLTDKYALALLANSITLTPGTITIEVAEEKDGNIYMYVQWLVMETEDSEAAAEIIKGRMERFIQGVWA